MLDKIFHKFVMILMVGEYCHQYGQKYSCWIWGERSYEDFVAHKQHAELLKEACQEDLGAP